MSGADYDIITFDCYGTLIDWESGIVNAFRSEAAADGVELDPESIIAAYMAEEPAVEAERYRRYRDVLGETAQRVSARLGWKIEPERAGFLAASISEWRPFIDTNPALERLARKFQLGILSNIDDDLLEATLRHLTVPFAFTITAEQLCSYKPRPAHFQAALARTQGKRLLHAAQSYFHDVVPTRGLRAPVAWVNRKGESLGKGGIEPTYMVKDLDELADLLTGFRIED
jgi:2-haloacid dehalogenase/putative hydrolase of the HAD superfamily